MATKTTTTYTTPKAPTFNAGTFGTNIMNKVTGVVPKVTGPVSTITLPKTPVKTSGGVVNNVGAPQYTPKSGVGTKQGNYTYTPNGWQTPSTGGPNGVLLGSTQNTPVYGPKPIINTSTGGSTTKTTTTNTNYSPTINDMGGASYGGGNYSPTAGANYGTTTGTNYGATTAGATGGMATAGDLVNGASYSDGLTNEERDLQRALEERQQYLDELRNQDTNESSVMNNVLRQFQGEIDATERVYADKLAEAKITGRNRLGMDRAENFNAGATNSSFANASADRTMAYNDQQYSAIENEKLARIMAIQGAARELGQKFLADKKASKEAGYSEYINNLNSTKTLKDAIVTKLATNILNSGIDINTIKGADLTKIAQDSGTTVDAIKSTYQVLKKANDAAVAKAMKDGQFDLSEGESRYDINGNLIAKNNKTYKGTGSGSGGGTGAGGKMNISATAQSYVDRINAGSMTEEDAMKMLPGVANSNIRNEINMAIASQRGTMTEVGQRKIDEQIKLIDDLLKPGNGKGTAVGASIGKLIPGAKRGGLQPRRVGFETKVEQLSGLLTLDKLGLLKGPLSDADREFLQTVSSGLKLNMSEAQFDERMKSLKLKMTDQANGYQKTPVNKEVDDLLSQYDL